jgi:Protein of unknown function (DUF3800)
MQLLFIDESGTIPPKNKIKDANHFTLGGIVIPADLWHEVDKELASLKTRFKITGEIKWRYFAPGANSLAKSVVKKLRNSLFRNSRYVLMYSSNYKQQYEVISLEVGWFVAVVEKMPDCEEGVGESNGTV